MVLAEPAAASVHSPGITSGPEERDATRDAAGRGHGRGPRGTRGACHAGGHARRCCLARRHAAMVKAERGSAPAAPRERVVAAVSSLIRIPSPDSQAAVTAPFLLPRRPPLAASPAPECPRTCKVSFALPCSYYPSLIR